MANALFQRMNRSIDFAAPALSLFLALLASSAGAALMIAAGPSGTPAAYAPVIQTYATNGTAGTQFTVTVAAVDGSQPHVVPVELLRSSDNVLNVARFAFSGRVQVTIRVPNATNYSISPR